MNSIEFLNAKMAWFLSLFFLFAACYKYYSIKSLKDLNKFAGALSLNRSDKMRFIKFILICTSVCLITAALIEPVWRKVPKKLKKEGRDLVFILDVSNSMKAEDLIPNRLEKAKISITECVNSLSNHRIGLVVFAGSSTIKCPLTLDYDFFLHILSRVDTNSVQHGGTMIEDAVLKTCDKLFTDSKNGNKDIILISDGGDLGTGVDKAIEAINEIEAKIITIGLGDSLNGARIPLDSGAGFMKYKGKEVWTKLQNEQLKSFSKGCKAGAYLPAGTKQMDLAQIYEQFTQNEQGSSIGEHQIMVYKDEYPLFLGLAFGLLVLMVILPSKTRKTAVKALPLLILFLLTPQVKATSLNEAHDAYEKGKYEEAIQKYVNIVHLHSSEKALIYFNIANSYYRLAKYEGAVNSYLNTLKELKSDDELIHPVIFNLANALYKSAMEAEKTGVAIAYLSTALRFYRQIIMRKPNLKDAVINFELAKTELFKKKKEEEDERKKQEEIQKMLAVIRELLIKTIALQQANVDSTEKYIQEKKKLPPLKPAEEKITGNTQQIENMIQDVEKKDKVFKEMKVFEASMNHIKNAILNEKAAEDYLAKNSDAALPSEKEAHGSLQRALEKLPEDPQQQSSDKGESDEDGEESDEEPEEEGEDGDDNMSPDTSAAENKDEQRMDLPNDSIEDILKMEDKLHKLRKATEKKGRLKKVDKDW